MARYNILDALLPLSFIGVIGTFIGSSFWFYDIGEISDEYFTTVTPAGYAFSIWGLIWFTQAFAMVWLLIRRTDEDAVSKKKVVSAIAPWWIFGAIFEVFWLVFYGRETTRDFAISAVALIFGAFCFIQALFEVNGTIPTKFSFSAKACAAAGSAMNGAWLSVASCIGILTILPKPNEQIELGGVTLVICAAAGVFIALKTSSVVYPLVLVWALIAVVIEPNRDKDIRAIAIIGIALSGVTVLMAAARKLFAPKTVSTGGGSQYMTTSAA